MYVRMYVQGRNRVECSHSREQGAETRDQRAEGRGQRAEGREQRAERAESREQRAESREESREQRAESRGQRAESREEQRAESREEQRGDERMRLRQHLTSHIPQGRTGRRRHTSKLSGDEGRVDRVGLRGGQLGESGLPALALVLVSLRRRRGRA